MGTELKRRTDGDNLEKADHGLLRLGEYLRTAGYHFTTVSPLTHHYNNQRHINQSAASLRDIFGWSRPFEKAVVTEEEFGLMCSAEVLTQQDRRWQSQVRWASLGELLCVHSAYPTDVTDAVFFGPDTYRFAQLIEHFLRAGNHPVRRAVDIGSGSGAGALLIARAVPQAQVLAVDINRQALRFTEVNARLSGATNLEAVSSNLLNDITGEFDLIVANPPYMLDVQERAYRHGGSRLGVEMSIKIVDAALSRLTPGGTLLLYTGVAIIEGHDPFLEFVKQRLSGARFSWHYREVDPDIFSEELLKPAYAQVERIAAVALTLERVQ